MAKTIELELWVHKCAVTKTEYPQSRNETCPACGVCESFDNARGLGGSDASKKQVGGDHYMNMGVQPWDAMKSWLTPEQFQGYLLGTCIAYLARFNAEGVGKGGITDLKKGKHVLEKLLEEAGE